MEPIYYYITLVPQSPKYTLMVELTQILQLASINSRKVSNELSFAIVGPETSTLVTIPVELKTHVTRLQSSLNINRPAY